MIRRFSETQLRTRPLRALSCSLRTLLAAACVCCGWSSLLGAATQVVVESGVDSPDGNGKLDLFAGPTINAAGQIAFVSQLSGTALGASDNTGIFRRDLHGDLKKIVRNGEVLDGKTILGFFPSMAYISASGSVSSLVVFAGGSATYTLSDGESLALMYPSGMPSPSGQANALLGAVTQVVNDSGTAVYRGVFTGSPNESGLYQRSPDGTHSVRLTNGTAAPRGGTITSPGTFPTLNEANQIGTLVTINVGGPSQIRSAVRIDGTTVNELVREGDLLPDGLTTVGTFLSSPAFVSAAGQVAFAANLTRPGYSSQGIFLADSTTASCVATGVLPGFHTAANNLQVLGISDAGRIAFTAETLGGFDPLSAIYTTGTGGTTLVAAEDTATPVAGKFFRSFPGGATTINDAGQMAFLAELSDSVNGPATGHGLYFYDQAGLREIARTGDSFHGSTISNLYFTGTLSGTGSVSPDTSLTGLNELGNVAFAFSLANGNDGVAIWSETATTPGDLDGNGFVDAGDYVLWRKDPGAFAPNTYDLWRANFGGPPAAGSNAGLLNQVVPEPMTSTLLAGLGIALLGSRRRRSGPHSFAG